MFRATAADAVVAAAAAIDYLSSSSDTLSKPYSSQPPFCSHVVLGNISFTYLTKTILFLLRDWIMDIQ